MNVVDSVKNIANSQKLWDKVLYGNNQGFSPDKDSSTYSGLFGNKITNSDRVGGGGWGYGRAMLGEATKGAMTGMAGGPVGALIGGVVGAVKGAIQNKINNNKLAGEAKNNTVANNITNLTNPQGGLNTTPTTGFNQAATAGIQPATMPTLANSTSIGWANNTNNLVNNFANSASSLTGSLSTSIGTNMNALANSPITQYSSQATTPRGIAANNIASGRLSSGSGLGVINMPSAGTFGSLVNIGGLGGKI